MNRNTAYSEILVDELARAGLKHVVISPGSRNTPLVLAFAQHPHITTHSLLDERGAGFFALGLAMATGEAVAVLCTSGSATANYFPAVVEASQTRQPLIVITSDRPHELRFSGANQTIDQVKFFGDYALWAVDMPLPEASPSALLVRYLRTTASRVLATAIGERKGVVHLNVPFRKPLEPTPVASDDIQTPQDAIARADDAPYVAMQRGRTLADNTTLDALATLISPYEKGLIICGTNTPYEAHEAIVKLAEHFGYPLIADGTSGVRFGFGGAIGAYDSFLPHVQDAPQLVIRFGDVSTSQTLANYLEATRPHIVHIAGDGTWADDMHRVAQFVHADEAQTCDALVQRALGRTPSAWLTRWQTLEAQTWHTISQEMQARWFDGAVVHHALNALPAGASVFVGNSLSVRHLDQFGQPSAIRKLAYGNRGASGIDGNLATATGIAYAHRGAPHVAILGDVTLYHDLNSLLCAVRVGVPMVLIVLNNNGGAIFKRLPIKAYEPAFTDLFITPHDVRFEGVAKAFGWSYASPATKEAFAYDFAGALNATTPTLIEVFTDANADLAHRKAIPEAIAVQMQRNS